MNNAAAFDVLAAGYDKQFTQSLTGHHQRMTARKWLLPLLRRKQPMKILEINCGTGEDALWMASLGHKVLATDASAEMIRRARNKQVSQSGDLQFETANFDRLDLLQGKESFDLIFSNFAGLNCTDPESLKKTIGNMHDLLKPGGHMAFVVFGKYCAWETVYYLLKLQPATAFRRWKSKAVAVPLSAETVQTVSYFGSSAVQHPGLRLTGSKPVGLFIPPSYLEGMVQKRRWLLNALLRLEKTFAFSWLAPFADHRFMLLKKLE